MYPKGLHINLERCIHLPTYCYILYQESIPVGCQPPACQSYRNPPPVDKQTRLKTLPSPLRWWRQLCTIGLDSGSMTRGSFIRLDVLAIKQGGSTIYGVLGALCIKIFSARSISCKVQVCLHYLLPYLNKRKHHTVTLQ